ncbi:hypothetical protein [Cetacean poxvirus 1]|nr:hypothetical protein [Cetacean poxvirus 1]
MELIKSNKFYSVVNRYILSEFDSYTMSSKDLIDLAALGILGFVESTEMTPMDVNIIKSELIKMSKSFILYFDEALINPIDIASLLLTTCKIYNELIPYIDAHSNIVDLLDVLILPSFIRNNVVEDKDLYTCVPFAKFSMLCKKKLFNLSFKHFFNTPCMVQLIPEEQLIKFLTNMSYERIVATLSYTTFQPYILRYIFNKEDVLPYNTGLLAETSIEYLVKYIERFMKNPDIDFSRYLLTSKLCDPHIIKVIKKNLCVHASKSLIRKLLLKNQTYYELVHELGIRTHAYIGTANDIIEYASKYVTTLNNVTLEDFMFILDNVYVYIAYMDLKYLIKNYIENCDESAIWEYNPTSCLYVYDMCNCVNEDLYIKAIKHISSDEVISFKFITNNMIEELVKKDMFIAILKNAMDINCIIPYIDKVLKIEHICCPEFEYLFEFESIQEAYCSMFYSNPLYMGVVLNSHIKPCIKIRLLNIPDKGIFPLTKIHHYLYNIAYEWSNYENNCSISTPNTIITIDHDLDLYGEEIIIDNGDVLQIGDYVMQKMQVCELTKEVGGLRSIPETCHKLIYVVSGNDKVLAIKFTPKPINASKMLINIMYDLFTLMRHGIFYDVIYTKKYDTFDNINMYEALHLRIKWFNWQKYITLEDEFLQYSKMFIYCNQYLVRINIYYHYITNYILYSIIYWTHHIRNGLLKEFISSLLDEILPNLFIEDSIIETALEEIIMICDNNYKGTTIALDQLVTCMVVELISKASVYR